MAGRPKWQTAQMEEFDHKQHSSHLQNSYYHKPQIIYYVINNQFPFFLLNGPAIFISHHDLIIFHVNSTNSEVPKIRMVPQINLFDCTFHSVLNLGPQFVYHVSSDIHISFSDLSQFENIIDSHLGQANDGAEVITAFLDVSSFQT